ncbi:hypothetical protein DY000_02035342 [Brassica cretica]|uniref:Jacalin-type lectin domain-containing protein n=1 Tax=Brassica cretica TaxID=69181 RepID=A0ABQ7DSE1_BRACR|nr:hypothetical protein DY000_02035342 [Brassica cretica]
MKSSEYPEEFPRKFRGSTKLGFLGISSEYTDGIPRKYQSVGIFRGKMCSSEKTDEFRGNIIAVGGFYKIPRKFRFLGIFRGTGSSEYSEEHVPRNILRDMSLGIFRSIDVYMSKNASIDELPRKYPDEVLPRYIPRRFPTN